MKALHTPAVRRPALGLAVEGVAARDELLLKSLVRLLDHRTLHQWTFNTAQCDLKIVGEAVSPSEGSPSEAHAPVAILRAGRSAPSSGLDLALPVHPDDLEHALNRVGAVIVETRRAEAQRTRPIADDDQSFQLLRWPPAELLRGPGRLALATLLVSRPCTVTELHLRGCVERAACIAFLQELQRAQLLKNRETELPSAPVAAMSAPLPSGLFARIRRRLGLLSSTAE